MDGFTIFLLLLGATTLSAAVVLGPWYIVYKIEEWGCEK